MKKIDYQNLTAEDYKTFFREFRGCCLSDIRRESKGYASIINDMEIIKTLKNGVIILDNDITEKKLQERAKYSRIRPYTKEEIESALNKGYIITTQDNDEPCSSDEERGIVGEDYNGDPIYCDELWSASDVMEKAMKGQKISAEDFENLLEDFEEDEGREATESEKYDLSILGYVPDPKRYAEEVEGLSEEIQKDLDYKIPCDDFWYIDNKGFYSLRYE
jgi:hypothetical protein